MKEHSAEESGRRHRTAWESLPIGPYVPVDGVLVLGFLVVADAVLLGLPGAGIPLRAVFGFPLLFFLPGYALVAALFPGRRRSGTAAGWHDAVTTRDGSRRGLDWPQRLALSFGTSVVLLPLVGLALPVVGLGYSVTGIVTVLTAVTFVCTVVGALHRTRLPSDERFGLPAGRWVTLVRSGVTAQRSVLDAGLNVVLALAVVVSVSTLGYAAVAPNHAESFTSVSLLTETDDGELVAAGYPETLDATGSDLVLRVENDEDQSVQYTVVTQLQRVDVQDTSVEVQERASVGRTSQRVAAGETWTHAHEVRPELNGEDLRLVYYVYRGDPPAEPTTDSAYRHVTLWVDAPVQSGDSGTT